MVDKKRTKAPLPDGVLASDLVMPKWEAYKDVPYDSREFGLWHTTGFGWVIPTLLIARASERRRQPGSGVVPERTYAVTLDGKPVRVGMGPHVTERVTVYVTDKRLAALQRFLDLRMDGASKAGQIRDRISSRRAQGQMERAAGNSFWRWKV